MRALASALLLAACGGGISGVSMPNTAKVSGQIGGAAFVAMSATATFDATVGETIRIRDFAGACGTNPAEAHGFDLVLVDSSGAAVAGVYTIDDTQTRSRYATAEYATFVAGLPSGADTATSGAVNAAPTGDDLRGTFELSFASGAHVNGSFDAIACAGSP